MTKPFVAILMGSDSDLDAMQATVEVLDKLGVAREVNVLSAHRTSDATRAYVQEADARGCAVFIAAAGMAAHLAGTVAGLTTKPVIGVPMEGGPLKGQDALLSTVMMPGGVPVACVAIGKTGAKNAGYLAAQILALSDAALAQRVAEERKANASDVLAKNAAVQKNSGSNPCSRAGCVRPQECCAAAASSPTPRNIVSAWAAIPAIATRC